MTLLARYPSFELRAGASAGTMRLVPREHEEPGCAARALAEIARAHACIDHPDVPRVRAHDPTGVTFESDATVDLAFCVARAEELGVRIPYARGVAFFVAFAQVLARAHDARSDAWPRGHFLGGVSLESVRVRPDGRLHVLGFGHNFVLRRADGALAAPPGAHVDLRPPSPSSDIFAALSLGRSIAPIIELPPRLSRVFRGERGGDVGRLGELLDWGMQKILARGPKERGPSVEEAMAVYHLVWRILGVSPDPVGFRETLVELMGAPSGAGVELDGDRVVLGSGRVVELATRGAARRMLLALAEAARRGGALDSEQLFAAGWPGQRLDEATRARRVRVELSRLRSLGLREALVHDEAGFSLRLRGAPTEAAGGDPSARRPRARARETGGLRD